MVKDGEVLYPENGTFSSSSFFCSDLIPIGESGPSFFSTLTKCAGYIPQFVPHSLHQPSPIKPPLASASLLPKPLLPHPMFIYLLIAPSWHKSVEPSCQMLVLFPCCPREVQQFPSHVFAHKRLERIQ